MINIEGFCPMGCGPTLRAEEGRAVNKIVCWDKDCPEPLAAQRILLDRETEHVIQFTGSGFSIQHPLRERLDDLLMTCELHLFCQALPGPPEGRGGMFHGFLRDGQWVLERDTTDPVGGDTA